MKNIYLSALVNTLNIVGLTALIFSVVLFAINPLFWVVCKDPIAFAVIYLIFVFSMIVYELCLFQVQFDRDCRSKRVKEVVKRSRE